MRRVMWVRSGVVLVVLLSAVSVVLAVSAAEASGVEGWEAAAPDWPGWRGDGSGVSAVTELPVEWGPEEQVVWSAPLPGEGHSSPIVSGEHVFLTAATPGTSRHPSGRLAALGIWLLSALALAWSLGGDWRDPAGVTRSIGFWRRCLLGATLLGLAFAVSSVVDGKVGTALGAGVGAVGALALGGLLGRGDRAPEERPVGGLSLGSSVLAGLRWASSLGSLLLVALFLVLVLAAMLANEPHAYGKTWAATGEIVAVGLLAIVASLDRSGRARWLLAPAAIVAFAVLARFSPPSAAWYREPQFRWVAIGVVGASLALVVDSIVARRPGIEAPRPVGARRWGVPAALAGVALLFFVATNFLSTRSVLLREVISVDRESGEIGWRTVVSAEHGRPSLHEESSAAAPTPVTDGRLVFAHFGGVGVYALDFDGEIAWQRPDSAPPPHWGSGSSPILYEDLLIMTYDVDKRSFTEAVDTRTGETRWVADRTGQIETPKGGHYTLDAYSTPYLFEWKGRTELVTHAKTLLVGYDPRTGEERWAHRSRGRQVIPSTIQWNDLLIVGGAESQKYLAAVRIDEKGEQEIVWEAKRYQPELSSPVIYDDLLFTVSSSGIAACRDPQTGEVLWRERLPGRYYASLVAAAGRVYFTNLEGVTSVVAARPTFDLLARNTLGERTNATPAVAGADLFLRGTDRLYRIGNDGHPNRLAGRSRPSEEGLATGG